MHLRRSYLGTALVALFLPTLSVQADPVAVQNREGTTHGFLTLRTLEGKLVASGDLIETIHGDEIMSRLTFRFKDGSIDEDTSVFTQNGHFRLISDHHVQKGPAFDKPMDVLIDAHTGNVTVHYKDKDEDKVEMEHLDLPPDVANGMLLDIVKNISPTAETLLSFVAATPKPRLVKLTISSAAQETFTIAGAAHKATHFVVHVELGGIAGVVAPILGKEPKDTSVWISTAPAPAFVKSEGPLAQGGAILRTEMFSPVWPKAH